MEKKSEDIGENGAAAIIFEAEPLIVEKFSEILQLERFVLARKGKNIGTGVVL